MGGVAVAVMHRVDRVAASEESGGITDIVVWDSPLEMAQAVARAGQSEMVYGDNFPVDGDWVGRHDLKTWRCLVDAVCSHWGKAVRTVRDMVEEIGRVNLPVPRSIKRKPSWSDDVGDFDLERFREGQPAYRGCTRGRVAGQQFVTVTVDLGCGHDVRPEKMLWGGAATVAMAGVLEDQGYGVEVLAYEYGVNSLIDPFPGKSWRRKTACYTSCLNAVWVKRTDERMDLETLANVLSPWFFRTVMVSALSLVPGRIPVAGLGFACKVPPRVLYLALPDPLAWRIADVWSLDSAAELARLYLGGLAEDGVEESAV